nr:hypothetical protein B0A51_12671 [Rachicladosporium sp. CCFEE 5018]
MSDAGRDRRRIEELLRRNSALFNLPAHRNQRQFAQQSVPPADSQTAAYSPYVNDSEPPSLRRGALRREQIYAQSHAQAHPAPVATQHGSLDGVRDTPRTVPALTPGPGHAFPASPSLNAQERRERRDMERYFLGPHANRSSGEELNGAMDYQSEDLLSGTRGGVYHGPGDVRQAFDNRQARRSDGTQYREDHEGNARMAPLARPPLIPPPGNTYCPSMHPSVANAMRALVARPSRQSPETTGAPRPYGYRQQDPRSYRRPEQE